MIDNIPKYKPLPKNSKFAKANKHGQIPKDCISFNWCGKHCWIFEKGYYDEAATDCKVLKGEFCENYKNGGI